ncbi:kynurenine/alpha-aminoadipate aminotransferase, mitochondrial-like [Gigantopelta aegis]|uniref:kynurenine/alpha-aminoadipate aminotransferase, mitochondrial-like n=1 Tax=Gigantopelta aegis TaxID=1735272 RepID=UPI001B88D96B|nr:kynurenine/alpha-aminoadipate aminotransferase, mitochondrial-like [Gigantopelta aegis]
MIRPEGTGVGSLYPQLSSDGEVIRSEATGLGSLYPQLSSDGEMIRPEGTGVGSLYPQLSSDGEVIRPEGTGLGACTLNFPVMESEGEVIRPEGTGLGSLYPQLSSDGEVIRPEATGLGSLYPQLSSDGEVIRPEATGLGACTLNFPVCDAILDEGDSVLTEEFTYACVFNTIIPIGAKSSSVKSDCDGMLPSSLETVLSSWDEQTDGRCPRLMYCCPSAANPTGITWSLARKQEIYKIARTYGILILEDDPYFLIQFAKPRVPSFLSLDTDGRVIRLDTFTKLLSAGARLGYMSRPTDLLERITRHMVTTTCHPGNLSQIFILKVLQHMDHDGFIKHGKKVADFYKQRAQTAVRVAEKYLTGLAEWEVPHGGMFLWIHMLGVQDSSKVVAMAMERGAIFTDGAFFTSAQKPSEYIRMSFSLNSEEELDKAVNILATVIREEQQL